MNTSNVIFIYLGGFIAWAVQHYAASLGYEAPAAIANALPYAVAVALAHGWTMWASSRKALQDKLIQLAQARPEKLQKILDGVANAEDVKPHIKDIVA